MTTKEILIAARAKIDAPERWTQGVVARNADGHPTYISAENAVCWCIAGAITSVGGDDVACGVFLRATGTKHIGKWNDDPTRTHAEVLAAFDRAIAAAESV